MVLDDPLRHADQVARLHAVEPGREDHRLGSA
jgi:hypothetical protein